jgi:hypothetical protein
MMAIRPKQIVRVYGTLVVKRFLVLFHLVEHLRCGLVGCAARCGRQSCGG